MKLTRVTPAGLEVFGEVPTAFEFLVSEPPSQKNSNGNFKLYIKISFKSWLFTCFQASLSGRDVRTMLSMF